MDVPELIFQTLKGLVPNNRVFPNTFIQADGMLPPWPSIRYSLSAVANAAACGTPGSDADEVSVQIDVVHQTFKANKILKNQVIAALQALEPPPSRQIYFETFDVDTKTHQVVMTYLFQLTPDPV